jgi:glutamate racemase
VPIIEEGRNPDDPLVKLALHQYLSPLLERAIDVLVLGCTHYPILKSAIEAMVGPEVSVIDSADRCAEDVARRLMSAGLLRAGSSDQRVAGSLRCFVTDDSPRFAALAGRFLGMEIEPATWVSTEELHAGERALPLRRAV